MTEKGGECWLQTIYYPFMYFAKYARGYVLNTKYAGATYDCEEFKDVKILDHNVEVVVKPLSFNVIRIRLRK